MGFGGGAVWREGPGPEVRPGEGATHAPRAPDHLPCIITPIWGKGMHALSGDRYLQERSENSFTSRQGPLDSPGTVKSPTRVGDFTGLADWHGSVTSSGNIFFNIVKWTSGLDMYFSLLSPGG